MSELLLVSNLCIKFCRRSSVDKNTSTKCERRKDGQIEGWTEVGTDKGKTICPSPLCGRGIKSIASVLYGWYTLTGLPQQYSDWKIYFPDCQLSPLDELSVLVCVAAVAFSVAVYIWTN